MDEANRLEHKDMEKMSQAQVKFAQERAAGVNTVGETVVYPNHGAAVIEDIEIRAIKGEEREYLVLRIIAQSDLVVRVPACNVDLVGVRDVVDEDGLERVFSVIGSPAYRPQRDAFRERLRESVQRQPTDVDALCRKLTELALPASRDGRRQLAEAEAAGFSLSEVVRRQRPPGHRLGGAARPRRCAGARPARKAGDRRCLGQALLRVAPGAVRQGPRLRPDHAALRDPHRHVDRHRPHPSVRRVLTHV